MKILMFSFSDKKMQKIRLSCDTKKNISVCVYAQYINTNLKHIAQFGRDIP